MRKAASPDRQHLEEFVRTHTGVEAFVEPRTTVTETTVVLVAVDGEWTPRRVPSPQVVHQWANELGIPSYDAARRGLPPADARLDLPAGRRGQGAPQEAPRGLSAREPGRAHPDDGSGATRWPDRGADMNESAQLRRLLAGYQVTEALHVAVVLDLPDLLADGPRHVDDLADASSSHPATLYRLMRALAAAGVFEELADRRFASNGLSELLRADVENSLRPWVGERQPAGPPAGLGRAPGQRGHRSQRLLDGARDRRLDLPQRAPGSGRDLRRRDDRAVAAGGRGRHLGVRLLEVRDRGRRRQAGGERCSPPCSTANPRPARRPLRPAERRLGCRAASLPRPG